MRPQFHPHWKTYKILLLCWCFFLLASCTGNDPDLDEFEWPIFNAIAESTEKSQSAPIVAFSEEAKDCVKDDIGRCTLLVNRYFI